MNSSIEYFKANKYLYLKNLISKENCQSLVDHLFDLHKNKKTEKDSQCPLSDSVYGDVMLDRVLERLTEPLSKTLGIDLIPTYTYARIYRKGEVLKRHTDRESCEISGTMTLGFDPNSKIWPIYFSADENDEAGIAADIEIGDIFLYRGNDIPHWRPKYKGEWQAQVFFHYVDKNGPHAEWAYDKRKSKVNKSGVIDSGRFITNGMMINSGDNYFPGVTTFDQKNAGDLCFTEDQCRQIVNIADSEYPHKSRVGGNGHGVYDPKIRQVNTYTVPLNSDNEWIFQKIIFAVDKANREYYKFDLLGITHSLQLLHYEAEENSHYNWHIDVGPGESSTRKLSVSIPLTKPTDYEGGELEIVDNGNQIIANQQIGSITMFPSFFNHRVTPLHKGERWVLVVWVHGPTRFK